MKNAEYTPKTKFATQVLKTLLRTKSAMTKKVCRYAVVFSFIADGCHPDENRDRNDKGE